MKAYKQMTAAAAIVVASGIMLTGCGSSPTSTAGNPATSPTNTPSSTFPTSSGNLVGSTTNSVGSGSTGNIDNSGSSGSSSNAAARIGGGTTPQVTVPASPSAGQPSAQSSSPFPSVIQMAMGTFSSDILKGAKAPAVLPWPSSGSTSIFYQTEQSTTPIMGYPDLVSRYYVQLNSSTSKLGSFFGSHYSSTAGAQNAFASGVGDVSSLVGTHSTIQIGSGHTGDLIVNQSNSAATIYWTEGLWKIQVNHVHSAVGPTDLAKEVADYLDNNFMPVPKDKAAIVVSLDGANVDVSVTWLEDTEFYQVTTSAACKNPVETALSMAIHMQAYS